jgi:hypothetical protein
MKTATVLIAHAIVDISAAARNSAVMLTSVVESALASSHMLTSPSEMKPLKTARMTANDKNAFHPDECALINVWPHGRPPVGGPI